MAAPMAQFVEKLSARVIRFLGCNSGPMTLQGTNSYLVGSGKRRILIDTSSPNKPEYVSHVSRFLEENQVQIQEIIITHWHHDHVGAVRELFRDVIKDRVKVSKVKGTQIPDVDLEPETNYTFIRGDETFNTEGATLRAVLTPGHAEDHICLRLEEENSLFTGDLILGGSTTILEDLSEYMTSLRLLQTSVRPGTLYPGHGPVIQDGMKTIDDYIQHRNLREHQILTTLSENGGWMTAMDLVLMIYTEISESLHLAAMGNVLQHLAKLFREHGVEMDVSPDEFSPALRRCSAEGATRSADDVQILMAARWRHRQSQL